MPTDDGSGEAVDDTRDVDEAGPRPRVGEVSDPLTIRRLGCEVAVEKIGGTCRVLSALDRGPVPFASDDTGHSLVCHESVDRAGCGVVPLPAEVADHFAASVQLFWRVYGLEQGVGEVCVGDRPCRRCCAPPISIRAWGDLYSVLGEHSADRLDPVVVCTHLIDELDYLRRRGSSSLAKKIEADLRISLASLRSRFSRSSSLMRCCSAVVAPGACSASICACRVHKRSDSAPTPSFGAMALQAP